MGEGRKKSFIVYLKFHCSWMPCVLSDSPQLKQGEGEEEEDASVAGLARPGRQWEFIHPEAEPSSLQPSLETPGWVLFA